MSKISEAKLAQGYQAKPEKKCCGNCAHFRSDVQIVSGYFGPYREEKNLRCGVGGFKVGKMAVCNFWVGK